MTTLQSSAQKQLRQLIEQIERLEEEKKALAGDIRDKYLEAKAVGFDVKALRKIVSMRKKSKTDRQEEEAILAVYMHALGMLDEELQTGRCRARTTPTSWTRRSKAAPSGIVGLRASPEPNLLGLRVHAAIVDAGRGA